VTALPVTGAGNGGNDSGTELMLLLGTVLTLTAAGYAIRRRAA
jgi:LPXTG-motif cell wall-anchored protein